jgi:hypothetical protein
MSWGSKPKAQAEADLRAYKGARRRLEGYKGKHETAEFRRLNRAVIKAEKSIPWWRR